MGLGGREPGNEEYGGRKEGKREKRKMRGSIGRRDKKREIQKEVDSMEGKGKGGKQSLKKGEKKEVRKEEENV